MIRPRFSVGFQLALLACVSVAAAVGLWAGLSTVAVKRYVREEVSRRAFQYVGEVSRLAGRTAQGRSEKWVEMTPLLDRLVGEPGVRYLIIYGPQKKGILAQPSVPSPLNGTEESFTMPVMDAAGRVIASARLWYSPEAYLGTLWEKGRGPLFLLALLTGVGLGGVIYAGCWWLVFRPIRKLLDRSENAFLPGKAAAPLDKNEFDAFLRRFHELRKKLAESEENFSVLLSASKTMTSDMDIQEIHNRILDLVWRRLDRDPCLLWWQDEDEFLRIRNFRNFPPELIKRLRLKPGESGVGQCLVARTPGVETSLASTSEKWLEELHVSLDINSAAHFPLLVDGKSLGVLSAFSRHGDFFSEERMRMIASLMEYLSLATKSARLFEEMQTFNRRMKSEIASTTRELAQTNVRLIRRVRELRALYDLAAQPESPSTEHMFSRTLEHLVDLLEVRRSAVFLWDEHAQRYRSAVAFLSENAVSVESLTPWISRLQAGDPVFLERAEDVRTLFPDSAAVSLLMLSPIRAEKSLLGFIAAADKRGGRFDEEDVRLLALFARHIADILQGVQFRREREQRLRDLTLLQEVGAVLSSEPDLEQTLRKTSKVVAESLGADICAFLLYDVQSDELVTQPGAYGLSEDADASIVRIRLDDPKSANVRVFRTGKALLSRDVEADPEVRPHYATLWNIRSLMLIPLIAEQKTIGVLRLGHKSPNVFTEDHLRLARLVAEQAAVIVQNAKLYRQIRENVTELRRLNNIKSEFLSMVSHELKTPLTTLKGYVGVLLNEKNGPLTAQQQRFLNLAKLALNRFSMLIYDLVDSSALEAGKLKIEPAPTVLGELLQQAYQDHLPAAQLRKINLVLEPLPDALPVEADASRIRQVVDNLVTNAFKFTSEGGAVTLSLEEVPEGMRVSVRDSGIG
ncbi:MAG TPA: GAF domain-containing protein, partial [Elusimicrobiota bacterium]|nr:GAF domain-containing protein [Elusimicrobiota bacterium]